MSSARVWIGLAGIVCIAVASCRGARDTPGHVLDEAMKAGRAAGSLTAATEDYFHDMDGGVPLSATEVQGRNTWLVWTGGNDRFWDALSVTSFGALDLLKTISSRPGLPGRGERWARLGLVNEPCFAAPSRADRNRFGLWLDVRDPACPPDPFASADSIPASRSARAAR